MTFSHSYLCRAALPLALLIGLAQTASAQLAYHTVLSGAQETPPNASPATGSGSFVIDTVANTVDFNIVFVGLIGAETAAHIHEGATGNPGGIAFSLPLGSPKIGTWNYSQLDEAAILAGRMYVNIHTFAFGGGELRGQILPTPISYCEGANANCPCGNSGGPGEGCRNATGSGAILTSTELNSTVLDTFTLALFNLPSNQFGLIYNGSAPFVATPFGDGLRCVGGASVNRFPIRNSGPGGGFLEGPGIVAFSLANFPSAGHIMPGQTWYFQGWYRDPNGPCGFGSFNLSNALEVTFEL